ncbi:MAG: hypothetical protein Q9157_003576 [Trypethelium eluteriae]
MNELKAVYEKARRDMRIATERHEDAVKRFSAAKKALQHELQDFELDTDPIFEFLDIATDDDLIAAQSSVAGGSRGNELNETGLVHQEGQEDEDMSVGSASLNSNSARPQETSDIEARPNSEKSARFVSISPPQPSERAPAQSISRQSEGTKTTPRVDHEHHVGQNRSIKRARGRPRKSTPAVGERIRVEDPPAPNPQDSEKAGKSAPQTGKRRAEATSGSEPKRQRVRVKTY